ncbi:hypothetical protein [Rothia aerolata]|uniref:Uncharacterized protein n=1 Tax=Rothia aerolata TaxID=1812262 RepID=A0A917IV37_9MICC|nr:hypothetical protein [Rothia aerolata]GGH64483.1 hypothetical protein GCM10007359_16820 [Rothia aerolata]
MSEHTFVDKDENLRPYWPETVKVMRTGAPWLDSVVMALCYVVFFVLFFYFQNLPAVAMLLVMWVWQYFRGQGFLGSSNADVMARDRKNTIKSGILVALLMLGVLWVAIQEIEVLYIPAIVLVFCTMLLGYRKWFDWKYDEPAANHPEAARGKARQAYFNDVANRGSVS